MRFVVLGPVQAEVGGQPVQIKRAQRRAVLAFLLLQHGRTVSADELVDALWGEAPPATARTQVFAAVSAVRRALRAAGRDAVSSSPGGYRIAIVDDELDLVAFHRSVEAARQQAARSAEQAAATVRAGLELWRGTPLSGITGAFVEPARSGLNGRRVEALERLYEYELAAGRHQAVLAELTDLAVAHPFSEALAGHLMVALHRSGRSADALAVFRRTRERLVAELGIEPRSELDALHKRVLDDDPTLRYAGPPAPVVGRRYLPRDIPDFTGRGDALRRLDQLADETHDTCGAAVISAIGGVAGVGKTALATHWAHRSAARFPDGQLHLNLRGYDARRPMCPAEALGLLLRELNVPVGDIPSGVDEMAGLYRATVAGQRLLVLLDNARSADQVRPLLPASPGTFVLVTSRDALTGLVAREGARRLDLDILPVDDAVDLLAAIVGTDRVSAEPDAACALAAFCGYLPLALRIAAANLAATHGRSIAVYHADLAEGPRIPGLAVDGDPQSDLQNVFGYSYRALPATAQRLFRLLGLVPGQDVTVSAVAALAGIPPDEATQQLTALRDAYLVVERPSPGEPGRFQMHDLLREYAARLAGDPTHAEECRRALDRLADWTDRHVEGATRRMYPAATRLPQAGDPVEFADAAAARRWLEAELDNLVAVVERATAIGHPGLAWRIPFACRAFLSLQSGQAAMIRMGEAALAAASGRNDAHADAAAELVLAQAYTMVGYDHRALRHAERCLAKAREARWPQLEIDAFNAMSVHHMHVGDLRASAYTARMAFELSRALGVPSTQHLGKLGMISLLLGELREARDHLEETLRAQQSGGANHSRGITLLNLADTYRLLGRVADAGERSRAAIDIFDQAGSAHLAGAARCGLVLVHLADGQAAQALTVAEAARANLKDHDGGILRAQVCHAYGLALARNGRTDEALAELRDGLATATALRNAHPAIELMTAVGEVERAVGDGHALEILADAAERASAGQFAVLEAHARDLLAATHHDRGEREPARREAGRALALARRTGYAGARHAAEVLGTDG